LHVVTRRNCRTSISTQLGDNVIWREAVYKHGIKSGRITIIMRV
jgi:hypothetical protein